jgi:Catalase
MNTDHTSDAKQRDLEPSRIRLDTGYLTTQQGVRVDHTDDSLTAGERGPTLLEDFHAREKITHFDHERIPECMVHARGACAYGFFEPYDDWLAEYTAAKFLTTPGPPVFVRFSTVAGSRGSADTVRDVRGFATKFYTEQGNYDLVGNNFPVFFIQDGIKFPDFVHAVKPEPHNEIPQADTIASRKVAVLAADGVDVVGTQRFRELMQRRGAVVEVLAPRCRRHLGGRIWRRTPRRRAVSRRWRRCSTTRSWWRAARVVVLRVLTAGRRGIQPTASHRARRVNHATLVDQEREAVPGSAQEG